LLVMFLFFSPCILRGPSTDRRETLPHDRNWLNFIIICKSKIPPQKKFGAKNIRNFGQFCTTSDFDREYLQNEATYPKSKKCIKMSDEHWSTNYKELHVTLDPVKCTFW